MRVDFELRADVLLPQCVVGVGPVAVALAQRVLRDLEGAHSTQLRGVVASDMIVLLGDTEHLPWVDGVQYLGRDARAPDLLLPTQLAPRAPLDAFTRAVTTRARGTKAPWAVLVAPQRITSLAEARYVERERLVAWIAAAAAAASVA